MGITEIVEVYFCFRVKCFCGSKPLEALTSSVIYHIDLITVITVNSLAVLLTCH